MDFEGLAIPKAIGAWEQLLPLILSLSKWIGGCGFFIQHSFLVRFLAAPVFLWFGLLACNPGMKWAGTGSWCCPAPQQGPKAVGLKWPEHFQCSCAGHAWPCLPHTQQQIPEWAQSWGEPAPRACPARGAGSWEQCSKLGQNTRRLRHLQGLWQCQVRWFLWRESLCLCAAGSHQSWEVAAAVEISTLLHRLAAQWN